MKKTNTLGVMLDVSRNAVMNIFLVLLIILSTKKTTKKRPIKMQMNKQKGREVCAPLPPFSS